MTSAYASNKTNDNWPMAKSTCQNDNNTFSDIRPTLLNRRLYVVASLTLSQAKTSKRKDVFLYFWKMSEFFFAYMVYTIINTSLQTGLMILTVYLMTRTRPGTGTGETDQEKGPKKDQNAGGDAAC